MCVVETGSLNFTLHPLVYRLGMVCTVGGGAHAFGGWLGLMWQSSVFYHRVLIMP